MDKLEKSEECAWGYACNGIGLSGATNLYSLRARSPGKLCISLPTPVWRDLAALGGSVSVISPSFTAERERGVVSIEYSDHLAC